MVGGQEWMKCRSVSMGGGVGPSSWLVAGKVSWSLERGMELREGNCRDDEWNGYERVEV